MRSTREKAFLLSIIHFIIILHHIVRTSSTSVSKHACPTSTCGSPDNLQIRFPFQLKDRQPNHCGYPGFELSCTNKNETQVELPFSGKFLVKDINYTSQSMEIYDQNGCMPRRIIGFNLSETPFKTRVHGNYTFLNCSREVPNLKPRQGLLRSVYDSKTIGCLSNTSSTYIILCLRSEESLVWLSPGGSCKLLAVSIKWPNSCVSYSGAGNIVLDSVSMSWDEPKCGGCELDGGKCGYKTHSSSLSIGCYGIPPPYHKPKGTGFFAGEHGKRLALSLSFGLFGLALSGLIIFIKIRKKTNKEEEENLLKIEEFLENYNALQPTRYSNAEIKKMTSKLKTKLGQGGYGSVFEGKLANGTRVAVKVLANSQGGNNGEEFVNEMGTIGRIHHLNVVRLLGFCVDGSTRALIYEFMPNSSLDKFIFSSTRDNTIISHGWGKLQEIAIGIARGIEYLHQGCDQRILHFDIKPQNVLLDHDFTPKISDFGLAKLCTKGDSFVAISMAAARGTMGYIAPEVFSRNFGTISYKSDVYSFGVLLLEMALGRKNTEINMEATCSFPEWVDNLLYRGEGFGIQILEAEDIEIVKKLAVVALWCIQWNPVDRPSMNAVLHMLEGNAEKLLIPPNPFASTSATTIPNSSRMIQKKLS